MHWGQPRPTRPPLQRLAPRGLVPPRRRTCLMCAVMRVARAGAAAGSVRSASLATSVSVTMCFFSTLPSSVSARANAITTSGRPPAIAAGWPCSRPGSEGRSEVGGGERRAASGGRREHRAPALRPNRCACHPRGRPGRRSGLGRSQRSRRGPRGPAAPPPVLSHPPPAAPRTWRAADETAGAGAAGRGGRGRGRAQDAPQQVPGAWGVPRERVRCSGEGRVAAGAAQVVL